MIQVALITVIVSINILCIGIGFLFGVFYSLKQVDGQPVSFLKTAKKNKNTFVKIDEKKYVTEVSVDGVEKKFDGLGETTIKTNDIVSSVNKLKDLKR